MSPVDWEAEYNNRARVPEHPAIIEGWARDAAAYRSAAGARYSSVPYGNGERQIIDLFAPETPLPSATILFIHGGYWQALDRSFFSHMARGLNAHGITVAVPGYDLCPQVRIGDIVEEMRTVCHRLSETGPLVASGHSAGGHLAACLLATEWEREGLVPSAYAISGLFELEPLRSTSMNYALGMSEPEARRLSPLHWTPPAGRTLDAVVGSRESGEYLRQSRTIVERWGKAGVKTRYGDVSEANHFTVIAPLADPDSAMTLRLAELARTANGHCSPTRQGVA